MANNARQAVPFTTPPGRMLWGDVRKAQLQTEDDGRTPKKIKSGNNAGADLYMFNIGVAIPKTPGRDWKQEDWGVLIYNEALACWPGGHTQRDDFAYKVQDGDSTKLNKNMKRLCDMPGRPGHWILSFAGINAPQLFDSTQGTPVATVQPDIMMPGDLVQLFAECKSNESAKTAGMYLNPIAVCFRGFSPLGRIVAAAPVDASVFGAGIAAGASAMPASMAGTSGAPSAPAPQAAPPAPAAAPTPVTPNPAFAPPAPPTPPAPPAPAAQRMARLGGNAWPLATMLAQNWTEDTLRANGYTID